MKDYRIAKELCKELSKLDDEAKESQKSLKKWIASQIADKDVVIVRAIVKQDSIHIDYIRHGQDN